MASNAFQIAQRGLFSSFFSRHFSRTMVSTAMMQDQKHFTRSKWKLIITMAEIMKRINYIIIIHCLMERELKAHKKIDSVAVVVMKLTSNLG
eukprot:125684_1